MSQCRSQSVQLAGRWGSSSYQLANEILSCAAVRGPAYRNLGLECVIQDGYSDHENNGIENKNINLSENVGLARKVLASQH
jgi:hypothetical protein